MNIPQLQNPAIIMERSLGIPANGPKCLPLTLDFAAQTVYEFDYSNMTQRGFLDMCQTLWCDNSLSAVVLTVYIPGTNQTIKVPAGVQGYFTCLCPNPMIMTFTSTGGVVCQVTLCNFPIWS